LSNVRKIATINGQSDPRGAQLRRALIQALIATAAGVFLFLRGRAWLAIAPFAVAVLVLSAVLLAPPFFLRIERAGRRLGVWAGETLTWVLMALLFYLVFTPGRLLLWLARRDPMGRRFPTSAPSYWVRRPGPRPTGDYRRQY
jgi:hypothetical protein